MKITIDIKSPDGKVIDQQISESVIKQAMTLYLDELRWVKISTDDDGLALAKSTALAIKNGKVEIPEYDVTVLRNALQQIRDSRIGSFQATTGDGHQRCIEIATAVLEPPTEQKGE